MYFILELTTSYSRNYTIMYQGLAKVARANFAKASQRTRFFAIRIRNKNGFQVSLLIREGVKKLDFWVRVVMKY